LHMFRSLTPGQARPFGCAMHLSQGSLLREDSTFGLGLGVEKKLVQCNLSPPARSPWFRRSLKSWQQRLGTDHQTLGCAAHCSTMGVGQLGMSCWASWASWAS